MDKKLLLYILNERLGKIGERLFFFFLLLLTAYFAVKAFSASTVSALIYLLFALVTALITGILFTKIFLPQIAENFSYGLLFPRTFLKKAPVILSPIHGMINTGKYAEAEQSLLTLHSQYPADAEITWLLLELHGNIFHQPEKAITTAETFFKNGAVRQDPYYLKVLMFYADLQSQQHQTEAVISCFHHALRHGKMTASEIQTVKKRLAALETQNKLSS